MKFNIRVGIANYNSKKPGNKPCASTWEEWVNKLIFTKHHITEHSK